MLYTALKSGYSCRFVCQGYLWHMKYKLQEFGDADRFHDFRFPKKTLIWKISLNKILVKNRFKTIQKTFSFMIKLIK